MGNLAKRSLPPAGEGNGDQPVREFSEPVMREHCRLFFLGKLSGFFWFDFKGLRDCFGLIPASFAVDDHLAVDDLIAGFYGLANDIELIV